MWWDGCGNAFLYLVEYLMLTRKNGPVQQGPQEWAVLPALDSGSNGCPVGTCPQGPGHWPPCTHLSLLHSFGWQRWFHNTTLKYQGLRIFILNLQKCSPLQKQHHHQEGKETTGSSWRWAALTPHVYNSSGATQCPELRSRSKRTGRACGPLRSQCSIRQPTRKERNVNVPPGNPHVTGIVFCWPPVLLTFPMPHAQVGLFSMLGTDPKAARKKRNGSCLFLQSFNWVVEEWNLVKRILL